MPSAPLAFTTPASITGTAQEGSVLTAANGTTNDPNAASSVSVAELRRQRHHLVQHRRRHRRQTYTPTEADETRLLRVVETATDSGTAQSATSTSAATGAVADIVLAFTSAAAISGAATVGSALSAVNGALNDADASVTGFQWQSSSDNGATWSNIAGATTATYTPVAADQGKGCAWSRPPPTPMAAPAPRPTARRRAWLRTVAWCSPRPPRSPARRRKARC